MLFKPTALTNVDSYKLSHAEMYPEGTTKVYSNFTPRSDKHFGVPEKYKDGKIVWFGLQMFLTELKDVWQTTFFDRNRDEVVAEFGKFVVPFCGPNGFDLSRIEALHDLQYLPLEIKALPEASLVNIGVPVLTITNTDPRFYWLPNYLETWMSCELWKASTSATTSRIYRKIIEKYARMTGGSVEFIDWQGHDFSVRGMSGTVDAAKSGAGHLLSFTGTDNLPAVEMINQIYSGKEIFVGGSVPASEHSIMCSGGEDSEIETFRRLITKYPSGVVSIVSDTWDYFNVITSIAAKLKDEILNRVPDSFGLAKVVFRPDSGDPVKIICGYEYEVVNDLTDYSLLQTSKSVVFDNESKKYYQVEAHDTGWTTKFNLREISEAEVKGSVQCLYEIFGGTMTDAGYLTLNPRVGLIYGDSITTERAEAILSGLAEKGFASDNIVFGIGSFTFQYQTRDTFGFAMKATHVEISGEGKAIFKNPKTDNGTKKSAKGLLRVDRNETGFVLYDEQTIGQSLQGELRTVFLNGNIIVSETFENLRKRLKSA